MSLRHRLVSRLRRELFTPTLLGIAINPFHITRNALFRRVRQLAPALTGDVIDFGCGSKPYAALFTGAASYVGVDIETSGHDHRASAVDVYYDGSTLPFDNAHCNAVVSFETLEHIFNPSRILGEINRITKDGGLLLLTVPFVWDEHEVPYDCARYTSFGLRRILGIAGYEVLELHKTTSYVLTVAQMFIAYLSQHLFPRRGVFRHLCQLVFIAPLTALAYVLDALLPHREDLFCDCVVLARKARPAQSPVL